VMEAGGGDQVLRQLDLHDLPLNQFIEGMEIRGPLSLVSPYVRAELFLRATT